MGIISFFNPKPTPLLTEEDVKVLKEIERQSYLEEAKKIVSGRGVMRAKNDYGIKEVKKEWPQT